MSSRNFETSVSLDNVCRICRHNNFFCSRVKIKPSCIFCFCTGVMAELLNLKNSFFFNRKTSGSTSKPLYTYSITLIAPFSFMTSTVMMYSRKKDPSGVVKTIFSTETHTVHKMIKTPYKQRLVAFKIINLKVLNNIGPVHKCTNLIILVDLFSL